MKINHNLGGVELKRSELYLVCWICEIMGSFDVTHPSICPNHNSSGLSASYDILMAAMNMV